MSSFDFDNLIRVVSKAAQAGLPPVMSASQEQLLPANGAIIVTSSP
jgi:hypothetical protein